MRYLISHSLLSLCALVITATSGYAIAISSKGSQELLYTTSPNTAFSSLIKGTNPFTSLFVDYDRARKEAKELGVFFFPKITIWPPPDAFPWQGYRKTYENTALLLPADPAAALLEADHMLEVQVLAKLLKAAGVVHTAQNPAFANDVITSIKDLMNGRDNVRFISMELNAYKGRMFNQVLKDLVSNNGKCSIVKVDEWREDMSRSLFTYLHDNCQAIMTTAVSVEEKILKAKAGSEKQRQWLNIVRMMDAALYCLHVQVHWDDDGEPEVNYCDKFA